jgi:hypothetical protein
MPLQNPSYGLGYVPAYQLPGIPYITSSILAPALGSVPVEVHFPYVTRKVTVRNDGGVGLRVGFSVNGITGSQTNYFVLQAGQTFSEEMRVASVFMVSAVTGSATYATVIGVQTPIPSSALSDNWSGSLGVG